MFMTLLLLQVLATTPQSDGFAFFQPTITVSASERSALDQGHPVSRVLPATGREDAVFGAVRVNVDGDRLVAWSRNVEQFKKGSYILAIGRFSNPPRIEDLANVSLDEVDLRSIRSCKPGSCGLKLSAPEMERLRKAGEGKSDQEVQQEFRQILLERVQLYLKTGEIPPYEDQKGKVSPASHFGTLLDHTAFLTGQLPEVADYLRHFPSDNDPEVESFVYWSKEHAAGKPIISMTHVNIVRKHDGSGPDTVIVSRDIFSTHYIDASLSVTALISSGPGEPRYLTYMNRTEVDLLHGAFSGVVRHQMQRRVKANATGIMEDYRQRLESGDPQQPRTTNN
jgi:hypothetical protein